MQVEKIDVVTIESGKRQDIIILPAETDDWVPYEKALGGIVFDQLIQAGKDGEVLVKIKYGEIFKIEDD